MDDVVTRTSPAEPEQPSRKHRSRFMGRLLAIPLTVICALLATNNWCVVILPAVLAVLVLDSALRPGLMLRWGLAVTIGVTTGLAFRIGPDWAFREAFGTPPPPGIRDVRIWRHYLGGPGEHTLIIEFTADPLAVDALTVLRPEDPDDRRIKRWQDAGATWAGALTAFGGGGMVRFARRSWMRIEPLQHPEVFDFGGVEAVGGHLVLLHEPKSGRCVALHVRF